MAEKKPITPGELFEFFKELIPGEGDDGPGEVFRASPTVARRGLIAARMLVDIQKTMGLDSPGEAPPAGGNAPHTELEEARAELDGLLMRNMNLDRENTALREKIVKLQNQVERLYGMREMKSHLGRISEGAPKEDGLSDNLAEEAAARVPPEEREERQQKRDAEDEEAADKDGKG